MKESVLVVEDSKVSVLFIKDALKEYEVFAVNNGMEMWNFLENNTPDVILMDIMLPDADGYELTKKLQESDNLKYVPIIFQTAKSSSEDLKKAFEIGGIDFIRKPVDKIELQARVKSILRIKNLENELRQKSIKDYMTGIYNRRYFFEAASKNLEYAKRMNRNMCIAMIDIDFFKRINDTYGHDTGDFILKKITEIISANIRSYDIFARFGGEEFVIQFLDTNKSSSMNVLSRIRKILNENTYQYNDYTIAFTFSAGLVDLLEEEPKSDIDQLIKISDERLYKAKQTGRNKIIDLS